MKVRLLVFFVLIIFFVLNSFSEDKKKTVIYLKDGRIIAGLIIEMVPDQYVKIVSVNNVTHTIAFAEIASIKNERMDYDPEVTDTTAYALRIRYAVFAGISFPVEEFGHNSNMAAGYAKSGSIFGGEINFPAFRSIYANVTIAVINNSVDVESFRNNGIPKANTVRIENWNSVWYMPGLQWRTTIEDYTIFAMVNYGWTKVQYPFIFLSGNLSRLTSPTYSNTQSGYAVSIGGTAFGNITLGIRYYYSKPIFPVSVMSNPELLNSPNGPVSIPTGIYFLQTVSLITLTGGVSF